MASTKTNTSRLPLLLRPPGRGIPTLSTGGRYAIPVLKSLYGTDDVGGATEAWRNSLQRMAAAKCILIGIPSDTGAGLVRGSSFGPLGIRAAYLKEFGSYPDGLLDVGDVLCLPQLLHDDMLCDAQIRAVREALYPGIQEPLPVSPLSVAEAAISEILRINSCARIVMLGGDHGVAWPVLKCLVERSGDGLGILQVDAHTDLSPDRFGIKHCYNTWAYHVMRLLEPRRLVQIGIRASTKSKTEWITQHPVIQIWADEVRGREEEVIQTIIDHFAREGVRALYITNDIDGTDMQYAPATGSPEPNGLATTFVKELLARVGRQHRLIGGDLVEIAPPLSGSLDFEKDQTCRLGAEYLHCLLDACARS